MLSQRNGFYSKVFDRNKIDENKVIVMTIILLIDK